MTPDERREFEELKRMVRNLHGVTDVPFIENAKRRIVPRGLDAVVSKNADGTASGLSQSVNESGAASYGVAAEYDGSLTVADVDGNLYKLGYYNV